MVPGPPWGHGHGRQEEDPSAAAVGACGYVAADVWCECVGRNGKGMGEGRDWDWDALTEGGVASPEDPGGWGHVWIELGACGDLRAPPGVPLCRDFIVSYPEYVCGGSRANSEELTRGGWGTEFMWDCGQDCHECVGRDWVGLAEVLVAEEGAFSAARGEGGGGAGQDGVRVHDDDAVTAGGKE